MTGTANTITEDAKKEFKRHWQTWFVLSLIAAAGFFGGFSVGLIIASNRAAVEISAIRADYSRRADKRDAKVEQIKQAVGQVDDKIDASKDKK
ncbi:hypothetical protein [Sodalis sp. RH16]|uniref:hypothetical protein n=1 Tax=Sodalis sp. RH16 TaxID=3394331 RepID=UPI0039B39FD4